MLTTEFGAPVVDDNNIQTAGQRGPALRQDVWFLENLAHFIEQTRIVSEAYAKLALLLEDSALEILWG
jgi:catalase